MTQSTAPAGPAGMSQYGPSALAFSAQQLGAGLNAAQASKIFAAQTDRTIALTNAALAAERERQKQLTDENVGTLAKSMGLYQGNVQGEMDERSALLSALYREAMNRQPAVAATAPQARGMTADAEQMFMDRAKGRTNNLADALANLRSFGEVMADKGRQVGRYGELIDQNRNFMRGSRGVLNAELEAAAMRAPTPLTNPLGDLLRGGGQLGMYYGLADRDKVAALRAGYGVPTTTPVSTNNR